MRTIVKRNVRAGGTLVELIIGTALLFMLLGSVFMGLSTITTRTKLNTSAADIVQTLRTARTNSSVRLNDGSWGVYFDNANLKYVLFNGVNYVSRDTVYDRGTVLPAGISYGAITLNGGGNEIVFSKIFGTVSAYGTVVIQNNLGNNFTITSLQSGQIELQK